VRALVAAAAPLAVAALAACGGGPADASAPGGSAASARKPVVTGGYWPSPGRRTLRVAVERGACSRDLRLKTLRQGARSVRIAFDDQPVNTDNPCPMFVRLECVSAVLGRPLGRRAVIDAVSGRRVGRESLRAPTQCPRARR
jgi:hypothetical protein